MQASGAAGGGRRTFTEAARRAQIVQAAIETIAELGYARASFAQIARRAGLSSTGLISYHFAGKDDLIEQVVADIYTAGAEFMAPRIAAATGPAARLRAYIEANLAFIGGHSTQMMALVEIFPNFRTPEGKLRFDAASEEPLLVALEDLLRAGQEAGEFRAFATRPMAVTIRRAIDAVPPQVVADPDFDLEAYTRELVALFDRATRRDS